VKIDVFPHCLPRRYFERAIQASPAGATLQKRMTGIPVLVDVELRLRIMDRYEGYVQVLTLANPPIDGRPAARPARVRAHLRAHGGARPADLDAPGAAGDVRRLRGRDMVEVRHLVGLRLAVRDDGGDGAAGDMAALGRLQKRPIDYFRMFYGDTALFGAWHAMESMRATPDEKATIYQGNARRMLRLKLS
jgi:hypothetical protein